MCKREREVPEKKIEINASGLMKGQEDHQLLMETELLRRQGSRVSGIVRSSLILAA